MLEKDLEVLKATARAPALEGLEAGIWHRISVDQEAARARRIVLTCQASLVAMVVIGGIALSGLAPPDATVSPGFDAFSLRSLPAPSTLLLGGHT